LIFQTQQYTLHCRVAFLNLALALMQEMGLALMRVQNRSGAYVGTLTARLILMMSINVTLLTVFHLGALAMLLGATTATVLVTAYLDFRILYGTRWRFRLALFQQQFRYAYPLGLSALGMTFIHSGDRFFLQRFVTLAEIGLYGMAYKFGTLAGNIQPTFETYWNSQIFNIMKEESGERYYVRMLTYYALVCAAAAVVVGLFSQPVVRVVTPKEFHDAMNLCPLIAACYAWRAIGDYFRNAFAVHRKTGRNLVVTFSGVVLGAVTYSLLIPSMKLWGAAIATAITFVGMSVVSFHQAQSVHRYHFEWRRLWTIAISAIIVLLPSFWIGHMRIVQQWLCAAALTLLFPVLLWAARFFEPEEIRAALSYLRDGRKLLLDKARAVAA
jgi:O-antigen/teichoic acid export membrane protein